MDQDLFGGLGLLNECSNSPPGSATVLASVSGPSGLGTLDQEPAFRATLQRTEGAGIDSGSGQRAGEDVASFHRGAAARGLNTAKEVRLE